MGDEEVNSMLEEYCRRNGIAWANRHELRLVGRTLLKETLERRLRAPQTVKPEDARGKETPLLVFPCTGGKKKGAPAEWPLYPHRLEELQQAFPHIDVLLGCRGALAWVKANHPKTYDGMPRFLTAWLARNQDRLASTAPGRRQTPYRAPASLEATVEAAAKARKRPPGSEGTRRDCTCVGNCKGSAGLGENWRCVMERPAEGGEKESK